MQIIHNAISDSLNEQIVLFIYDAVQRPQWANSQFHWALGLVRGVLGNVMSTNNMPSELRNRIVDELRPYLPSTRNIDVTLNVWPPTAALNWHNDEQHRFGATVYLNDNWDRDWGGLFLYEDKETNQMLGLIPQKNMLVLNDKEEWHAVTPIALGMDVPRLSIQIFGKSDEETN